MLIDSLSAEWTAILTQGNQAFTDGELFATSQGSTLQDVYLYKGGTLTKYLAQPTAGLYLSTKGSGALVQMAHFNAFAALRQAGVGGRHAAAALSEKSRF